MKASPLFSARKKRISWRQQIIAQYEPQIGHIFLEFSVRLWGPWTRQNLRRFISCLSADELLLVLWLFWENSKSLKTVKWPLVVSGSRLLDRIGNCRQWWWRPYPSCKCQFLPQVSKQHYTPFKTCCLWWYATLTCYHGKQKQKGDDFWMTPQMMVQTIGYAMYYEVWTL